MTGEKIPEKIIEDTSYECPGCNGIIQQVIYNFGTHFFWRWTCSKCQRDYGYNAKKPMFLDERTVEWMKRRSKT
jgi:ssDNA-binding Zn-finger/Zn-ribbon topoisomerase 1